MRLFKIILGCLSILLYASCEGTDFPEISEDYIAIGHYTFVVESSLGGAHSFTTEGSTTNYRPGIRHMSLGPDNTGRCDSTVASITLNASDMSLDFQNLSTLRWDVDVTFYSILYWCLPLGDQESNFYTASRPLSVSNEKYESGIDANGVKYLKGEFEVKLSREAINEKDEPEAITVTADFVAVDR